MYFRLACLPHTDGKSTSKIDHSIISKELVNLVQDSGVIHRGENLSKHSTIFMILDLGNIITKQLAVQQKP